MSEAVDVTLERVRLDAKRLRSRIDQKITAADVVRTMEGASTFTLVIRDPERQLLDSKLFNSRVTTQVDRFSFELAQVKKMGDDLTVVFEELAVAALRRKNKPRKVAAGTMTREQFARALVDEVKWIKFRGPSGKQPRTKVELARGKTKGGGGTRNENTWDALDRLAQEVNWTRFVVGDKLFFLPEKELMEGPVDFVLREGSPEVDNIDFDFDIGKPVATLTATVRADRWKVPPGACVRVPDLGPAEGRWLVTEVSGSLFSAFRTVSARRPEPSLPEPEPPEQPGSDYNDTGGQGGGSAGGKGKGDWVWPCKGTVSSEYGSRPGGFHYGIDIAAPLGTPIVAARNGVVIFAGSASGYGKAVYIDHGGGVICRYGHMSVIRCARGQSVNGGDRIADVGQEGNSTGPHLHFEYRPGDSPRNPREIL